MEPVVRMVMPVFRARAGVRVRARARARARVRVRVRRVTGSAMRKWPAVESSGSTGLHWSISKEREMPV